MDINVSLPPAAFDARKYPRRPGAVNQNQKVRWTETQPPHTVSNENRKLNSL
jgi:hypothetical protein